MLRQYDITTVDMYAANETHLAAPTTMRCTQEPQNATHMQSAWGQTCCKADRLSIVDLQLASCAGFDQQRFRMANGSAIEFA